MDAKYLRIISEIESRPRDQLSDFMRNFVYGDGSADSLSIRQRIEKYGKLTDKQLAVLNREAENMAGDMPVIGDEGNEVYAKVNDNGKYTIFKGGLPYGNPTSKLDAITIVDFMQEAEDAASAGF